MRQVALNAYATARSQQSEYLDPTAFTFEEERDYLAKNYQFFGIAQGPEHARQLIRDIETAAVALGQGRSPA